MASVERLWRDLMELATIGAGAGRGITRLAFSQDDLRAKMWVIKRFKQAGLQVHQDSFGNVFARRPGRVVGPAVAVGSHLDTVVAGGKFDGALGVLAALEVARSWNESGLETELPLEIVVFAAEESARFGVSTLGSRAVTGQLNGGDLDTIRDRNGVPLSRALEQAGFDPRSVASCVLPPGKYACFVELHIEQGPELERLGVPVGLVTGIAAPTRFRVTIEGTALHSGTVPMGRRRDALVAAAQLVEAVEAIALSERDHWLVGTVASVDVFPGSTNTIPGRVEMRGEFRSTSREVKDRAMDRFLTYCEEVRQTRGVTVEVSIVQRDDPTVMHEGLIEELERTCRELEVPYHRMPSGAGHDAMNMGKICPAAMIFVPSRGGVSHHPDEWTDQKDLAPGLAVLDRFLTRLTGAAVAKRPGITDLGDVTVGGRTDGHAIHSDGGLT
ncbi:Zn-dependent hydrolase [Kyrpidia tusciae]|uniref:Amidase, hydantoinase/carbamoylase family n=1 Tax=Kyrpidia tusciae (strain DSM 2912 / NBRC 15312 / T2) TaxID=562970 RepID=D5WY05_KYRT2|nr:Zn-dependent hydrolase [Kyrpidia tusciae]ADG06064.1 amidase, hydantoinase/carbamoylase family [Kyrpidia tusciae DSM 2912]